jgi:signal transduction histidine kinase
MTFSDDELLRVDYNEKSKQFIQNAIEVALSLGDFQKEIHGRCTPQSVASKALGRIGRLIRFDASAIYLVDEETSDMHMSVCSPSDAQAGLDEELEFLIQNGFVAWAIRERRGITVFSKDGGRQLLLHVMATYARTRGLFMGTFPAQLSRLPDASLEILSIILRNAANGIESLVYSNMLQQQKMDLEKTVEQKTRRLIHYEKQLVQAQNMEAIAALAGGVAHQFNNALTGMIGNLDLLSMITPGTSEARRYIERMRPIVERMTKLTSQLLAYAQGGKYMTQAVSVKDIFNEALPAIRQTIKKTIRLSLEVGEESITVNVDTIQMRMAVLAVVNNADEAIAREGSICIRSRFVHSSDIPEHIRDELRPGDYVCISFQDTGTGMDSNTLRRLFEPFFSTKFEGRGLSMAAVSGIIKSHNGWIDVTSQLDQGTSVQIYLPCVRDKNHLS